MEAIDQYLDENRDEFLAKLCELLRIPSVSADSQYAESMKEAGDWVSLQFQMMGLTTETIPTDGNPVIYAEWIKEPNAPTVLVYGHYDVQPQDPLDEWISPPFEPTERDGNIYARGATDDKGQMLTHVFSTAAWLATENRLPINLKFLIEGEEEVGSPNLVPFIESNLERLKSDIVVISDTSQFAPNTPAITYGLRGIAFYEIFLSGPKQDLHSGTFGGAVTNPANALTKMLGQLLNDQGRIQIPGFYDDVIPLTEQERKQFAELPFDEEKFKNQLGVNALTGEEGFTTLERRWARPTCDINGLTSGYQGEGAKTVLPAKAAAKLSCRLVPNQDPDKVEAGLRAFLEERLPAGLEMEIRSHHGAPGVVVPLESPFVTAASEAIANGFGVKPVFIREGGSIPVVSTFSEKLGIDTLLLGWGLDDDNTHSPNEKFNIEDFHRGIKASAHLWNEISKIQK